MASDAPSERVLIVAPVGRDAAAIAEVLGARGYRVEVCLGASHAAAQVAGGAGALVLTEESLDRDQIPELLNELNGQPTWSELPVIILTSGGESRSVQVLDLAAEAAGSITLLERPLGAATLLRTIDVALRSRRRQYQVRDLLEEQRAREAALREADRRKDTFLAILSHELRNPLAPIRTAADLLGTPGLTPAQLRWAENVIRRQTGHMASLLDDLLDLAAITQGKLRLRLQSCSLQGAVEAAVETARPVLERKGHRLAVALPDDLPPVTVDSMRLSQAIANLLTNAAKYTDAGGSIELGARVDGALVISVVDNGIGFSAEQRGRLFLMFSQLAPGNRSEGGLGIGLALVKAFIELHGGTVDVESAGIGRGSVFIIRLPLTVMASTGRRAHERIEATAAPAKMLRVLIADDNRDAADSLALLLSLSGHEVRTAYDGASAVSIAEAFQPEVALLDVGMPKMDGYAAARAIRRQAANARTRLIAVTGWGQEGDKQQSRDAGFALHLTKPIDPDKLRDLLRHEADAERVVDDRAVAIDETRVT